MKGVKTIKRGGRWLRSRFQSRGLILLYHRVATTPQDPFSICVSPVNFEAQMKVLRESCMPISLPEMVAAADAGTLPQRAVSVTFDDGYFDNLAVVLPILEKFDIPATFFVVSGSLGEQFWWDRLAWAVFKPDEFPGELTLTIDGRSYNWQPQSTTADRELLLEDLFRLLRPLDDTERGSILAKLQHWAGINGSLTKNARPLTKPELIELANGKQVTIGAHTVGHPPLASLPLAQQSQEIKQSKAQLEAITGQEVLTFSFPFGMPSDYSAETIKLVQQAGFKCACTNVVDVIRVNSDNFQLPRYWIQDWNPREFRKRLLRWL